MTVTADVRPDEGREESAEQEPEPTAELAVIEDAPLALRPGQTVANLTQEQRAGLRAVLNFDPGENNGRAFPHIEVFLHFCLTRGLDPFTRQAYLIARGPQNDRTYTIQMGIDGYRSKARDPRNPRRYVETVDILWTTDDDDEKWWHTDDRGVRRRVWTDTWIWGKDRHPSAAKAIIAYYDDADGQIHTEERIAHWGMFAPYVPEYEDSPNGGRRKKRGPDGKPIMKLTEMWAKDGGAHMLGKCAEAQAIRAIWADVLGGTYTPEEMHKADVESVQARQVEAAQRRVQLMQEDRAQRAQEAGDAPGAVHTPPVHTARARTRVVPGSVVREGPPAHDGPVHIADAMTETVTRMQTADDDARRGWLLDEVAHMAEVMGKPVRDIVTRRLGQNPDEVSAQELLAIVGPMRPAVIARMREQGRDAEAQVYAQAGAKLAAPINALLGLDLEDAHDDGGDVHTEAPQDAHTEPQGVPGDAPEGVHAAGDGAPAEDASGNDPHPFCPDTGTGACMDCDEPEDNPVHQPPPGGEDEED